MNNLGLTIALSHNQDVYRDVDALVRRIAGIGKRNPIVDRLRIVQSAEERVIDFILNSNEIWADTGVATSLGVETYLKTFKEYERLWASRKNEGTPEKDWYKMQDELAEYIKDYSFDKVK